MRAVFGRKGFSKIDSIAQVSGAVIEYGQPINYEVILDLESIRCSTSNAEIIYTTKQIILNNYIMNPSEEQLQREAQEMNKYYQIACEKFNQEKFLEAIDWFTKSINASNYVFNTSAIVNRGISRMILKQYKEAIEDFNNPLVKRQEAERNETDQILYYTNLGYCYFMIGKINDAKNYYQKVLSINPYNSDAKYMLSKIHQ